MASQGSPQKISPVPIEAEMRKSYIKYAMSVIVGRALPDVRDGLKPVQRRILYAMYSMGLTHTTPHKKAARVVGECLGKFHPHGDTAVYDALVRMAQEFSMRYPLIGGQGNFGSVDGDEPAAMRYTEVRLAKISDSMLADIEKQTVDFSPNFDDSLEEPTVLPTILPNLLVNGSSGIAVGMSCNIPPHNLREIVEALVFLIDNSQTTPEELAELVKGPDFPSGGVIYDRAAIRRAYETGRGILRVAGRVLEEERTGERKRLVISEIPYQVNKSKIVQDIANLAREGKIQGIAGVRDESSREGIRIVVELRPGAIPALVKSHLMRATQLDETFSFINLVLVNGQPKILNLKETLQAHIDHRVHVVERRTKFDLEKAKERAHVLEGYVKALDQMEKIIETIKKAESITQAREALGTYGLSEKQAEAILQMRLQQLTRLERRKISEELEEKTRQISSLSEILADRSKLLQVIKEQLTQLSSDYGDSRRTEITEAPIEIPKEEMIPQEDVIIPISAEGYLKRLPVTSITVQGRGGKGLTASEIKETDRIISLALASTRDNLLCFTNKGKAYSLKAYDIPEMGRATRGTPIINLIQLNEDEKPTLLLKATNPEERKSLVLLTTSGVVKRMEFSSLASIRSTGVIAITLDEDENLADAKTADEKDEMIVFTAKGLGIRFPLGEVPVMSRNARGVAAVKLEKGDRSVALSVVSRDEKRDVMTVTSRGYGKRTEIGEYRAQSRGGKGIINLNVSSKTGMVVSAGLVSANEDILIITEKGQAIRVPVEEAPSYGRNSQGVLLMKLDGHDQAAAMTILPTR